MYRIVEYCTNNTHLGTEKVIARFEGRPDVDTIEYGCLGNCGQCYLEPFALVDGNVIWAETADELYEKLLAAVEEPDDDPFADLDLD